QLIFQCGFTGLFSTDACAHTGDCIPAAHPVAQASSLPGARARTRGGVPSQHPAALASSLLGARARTLAFSIFESLVLLASCLPGARARTRAGVSSQRPVAPTSCLPGACGSYSFFRLCCATSGSSALPREPNSIKTYG